MILKNYRLVKDYDYDDEYDEFDCGQVFVVDDKNETICTIEMRKVMISNHTTRLKGIHLFSLFVLIRQ